MLQVQEAIRLTAPWAALYNNHPLVQSGVVFAHISGLMVGGGAAVAAVGPRCGPAMPMPMDSGATWSSPIGSSNGIGRSCRCRGERRAALAAKTSRPSWLHPCSGSRWSLWRYWP